MSEITKVKLPDNNVYVIKDDNAVSFVEQSLTTNQQAQARANINAVTAVEDGTIVPAPLDNIAEELRDKPSLTIRRYSNDGDIEKVMNVTHPLMNYPGAEIVLLHYSSKNGKRIGSEQNFYRNYKKGFCVAMGKFINHDYFVFDSTEMDLNDLLDYINIYYGSQDTTLGASHFYKGMFGIALRIPNPDYTGPTTAQRNARYMGVQESLWSDVLRIIYFENKPSDATQVYKGVGII